MVQFLIFEQNILRSNECFIKDKSPYKERDAGF